MGRGKDGRDEDLGRLERRTYRARRREKRRGREVAARVFSSLPTRADRETRKRRGPSRRRDLAREGLREGPRPILKIRIGPIQEPFSIKNRSQLRTVLVLAMLNTPYTIHHTPYTIHSTFYILHSTFYILHSTSYIIYHISYIIYHISYIIYHISYIIYHTFYRIDFAGSGPQNRPLKRAKFPVQNLKMYIRTHTRKQKRNEKNLTNQLVSLMYS